MEQIGQYCRENVEELLLNLKKGEIEVYAVFCGGKTSFFR